MDKVKNHVVFEVGDRVIDLNGNRKGTITMIGRLGETAQVKWDNSLQEMVFLGDLKIEVT
jgi:hypothetical protein